MSGTTSTPAGVPLSTLAPAAGMAASDTLLALIQDPVSKRFVPMQIPHAALAGSLTGPGLLAPLDATGALVLGGVSALSITPDGHMLIVLDLPTSDPLVKGALWSNGGTLSISAGPATS
ncbi:hypothetical protein [Rhizosaccharibacter radicis]|uniref:Uncharacterized protein n=1 Tax=Rhizosaccharibacter radicis TaxID=2782605 RepID=A0ABT1VX55_9PROT|nr:hypothetical protein [Acetobacteraceae bacterium KSS12]